MAKITMSNSKNSTMFGVSGTGAETEITMDGVEDGMMADVHVNSANSLVDESSYDKKPSFFKQHYSYGWAAVIVAIIAVVLSVWVAMKYT